MKKGFVVLVFFLAGFFNKISAQAFAITVPSGVCAQSAVTGSVTAAPPNAVSFSWSANPAVQFAALNPSMSAVNINFSTCGTYTIFCNALNSSNSVIGTYSVVSQASCSSLNLSPVTQTICAGATVSISASGAASYTWSTGSNTSSVAVSPSVTTVYTVVGNNSVCASSATVFIYDMTLSSSSSLVCSPTPVTLTANGGDSFVWFQPPNTVFAAGPSSVVVVTPTAFPITYTVLGGWMNSCNSSKTITIGFRNVNVQVASSPSVCAGGTATLEAFSSVQNFSWSAPGFSAFNYSISNIQNASTVYTVTVDSAGCKGIKTITVGLYPAPVILIAGTQTICTTQTVGLSASGASSYTWTIDSSILSSFLNYSIQAAPVSTTIYSVTGTSSLGCVGSSTYMVVLGQPVNLQVVTSATSVCSGSSASLSAYGAGSFTWSSTNFPSPLTNTMVVVGPGNYSVFASNGGSCVDSTVINIGVMPPLSIQAAQSATVTCIGPNNFIAPVTLSATGAPNFSWAPNYTTQISNIAGPITYVTPTAPTCFTVTGYTAGCSASSVLCVSSGYCSGIEETYTTGSFDFYPNPFKDIVIIHAFSHGELFLTDSHGKLLLKKQCEPGKTELDLSQFARGLYYLRYVARDGGHTVKKVMKE